jgi:hypothetical protein
LHKLKKVDSVIGLPINLQLWLNAPMCLAACNSLLSQFFISLSPKVLASIIEPIITVQYQNDWDDGSTSSNNEGVGGEASLMGRTIPSFRIALEMEEYNCRPFRNALDKSDRRKLMKCLTFLTLRFSLML